MRCLACDALLSDRENSRKYTNYAELPEGEGRYIGLCDHCIQDTDLLYYENGLANSEKDDEDDFHSRGNETDSGLIQS